MTCRTTFRNGRWGASAGTLTEWEGVEPCLDEVLEGEVNRSSRDYVRWVQQSMNRIMGLRLAVDGVMGSQTRSAVRSFQQRAGLRADGIVGPATERALIAAGAPPPPGSVPGIPTPPGPLLPGVPRPRGSAAHSRWVQQSLNQILGLRLAVDGVMGTQTRSAVRSFQQRARLVVDGVVGPRTEAAILVALGAPRPPVTPSAPTVVVRKRSSTMTATEQDRFVRVMRTLINAPGDPNPYGTLVGIHAGDHQMHGFMGAAGVQRFLPWHREYLLKMEQIGRALDSQFFLPYWDWTTEREIPRWLADFRGFTVKVDGPDIVVERNPPANAPNNTLPTTDQVTAVMAQTDYTVFTDALETGRGLRLPPGGAGMHNLVHVWINGTMSVVNTAPADPLFWLHHAQIDRLWALWQVRNPTRRPGRSPSEVLDPWSDTIEQMNSLAALGYTYGP
jgi:tyrosinase